MFANEVGALLRHTLFRSRIWRPSLVRDGLLGQVVPTAGGFEARWTDEAGQQHTERLRTHAQAVQHVAGAGPAVPPNMVQRVTGHERSSTTLDLYTRRTDNGARTLNALDDPDGEDPDDGAAPVPAPT